MSRANLATESWLNALVDGDPLDEHTAQLAGLSGAAYKLTRVQLAFAQLHRTVPTSPRVDPHLRFHWRHLAVLDRLGAGGYGEVFRAYDSGLEREVALKLRRANNQFSAAAGRAFIEEARRLAQVRHPNVLAVHGAAVDQGRAGIWTDLLIGETLAARIIRDGPMRFSALLALATELAAALSAVHARAIVHGDLKPANVMCEAGQDGAYVLMDFGAGAQLDKSGQTRLYAGTLNFMAPEHLAGELLGTAVDIYALGAAIYFAATARVLPSSEAATRLALKNLRTREDLPKTFVTLLTTLLAVVPADRPSAAVTLARCHALVGEGERRTRSRLRMILSAILLLAVIGISTAAVLTIRAQSAVEIEANRAAATKDFLLAMMRNSNPYQSPNPTRSVTKFFESAIAQLPTAFANDPRAQAQLLSQFGRTLANLEQDTSALDALWQGDRLLMASGDALTNISRIILRGQIIGIYRTRREYAKAVALANEQAQLCAAPSVVSAKVCIQIVNNQIVASEPTQPVPQSLKLVEQNLLRAKAAGLVNDEQTIYTYALQALFIRELGQAPAALAAALEHVNRSSAVNGKINQKLADLLALSTLAFSADDLGDAVFARELNRNALTAYTVLLGEESHKTNRARLQAATFAMHAGDYPAALAELLILRTLAQSAVNATWIEQATLAAALAGDAEIADGELLRVERNRQAAVGDSFRTLAEFRLGLAAVAIKRGDLSRAHQLLAQALPVIEAQSVDGLKPSYWQLTANLARAQPTPNISAALMAEKHVNELLAQQQRKLFDPVRGVWIGSPIPDATRSVAKIKAAAAQIYARQAQARH